MICGPVESLGSWENFWVLVECPSPGRRPRLLQNICGTVEVLVKVLDSFFQLLAEESTNGKSADPTVWLDRLAVIFR